jgi:hypothetical protein
VCASALTTSARNIAARKELSMERGSSPMQCLYCHVMTDELVAWLCVSRYSIYRYSQQSMSHDHVGPRHRFKREDVEAWMKAQSESRRPKPVEHVPARLLAPPRPARMPAEYPAPRVAGGMSAAEATKRLKELMG